MLYENLVCPASELYQAIPQYLGRELVVALGKTEFKKMGRGPRSKRQHGDHYRHRRPRSRRRSSPAA
jgi:hypothetical protein